MYGRVKGQKRGSVFRFDGYGVKSSVFINLPQPDMNRLNNFVLNFGGIQGVNLDDIVAGIMIENHGLESEVTSFLDLDAVALDDINGNGGTFTLFIDPLAKILPICGVNFLHIPCG